MTSEDVREQLRPFVEKCVIRHATADIELASGRMSDFYFDGRIVTLSGESLALFARLVIAEAQRVGATAIGGPTIGADPIVGASIAIAAAEGKKLKGFLIRKEPKSRGTKKQIEGPPLDGERALFVEDTITSGGSLARGIEAFKREQPGCAIAGSMALVDREEGGAEILSAAGAPLSAVFRKSEFEAV